MLEKLRPEIALSWARSERWGLSPTDSVDRLDVADYDRRSRLLLAAGPALDKAAQELAGTPFSLLLADRDGLLVDRRVGEHELQSSLDGVGVIEGRLFVEETTGTNSIATAFELRRGIAVHGEEHFIDELKTFSCYGLPITHPITARLEGVLDVTCPTAFDSPLLVPFLHRAVADIKTRLAEGSRHAEQRMLTIYQEAARRARPTLMLGDDVMLANTAATDLLEPTDHAVVRSLATEAKPGARRVASIRLSGGAAIYVHLERIAGAGVLVELEPVEAPRPRPIPRGSARAVPLREPWHHELAEHAARGVPVLISGEPGSGRTSAAHELAGTRDVVFLGGPGTDDLASTLARYTAAARMGAVRTLLVADGIEDLDESAHRALSAAVEAGAPWLALTSGPVADLTGTAAELATRCIARVELPPLRLRRGEIPALLSELASAGSRLRFLPRTVELLAAQPWPGNLRELAALLRHLAAANPTDAIAPADLPEAYRRPPAARSLTAMEQLERDAITAALRTCAGNKTHAAERLGISRSTLHRRIRALAVEI
jgi:transcriptional regulator of acetoin/glycerol metabolism